MNRPALPAFFRQFCPTFPYRTCNESVTTSA
jgi:hypothetical protein